MAAQPLRANLVALIVACSFFMYNLDQSIVATALPQIAASFDTSPVHLSIAITVYQLSIAAFIPISGWVADRFGARTVFCAAIGVFTLGSLLCGVSNSTLQLTLARIVQGLGGAMVVPVGRLVVVRSATKAELVAALAYLSMPTQLGAVLGPPVGGFITTYASWRWIFLINLPIGMIGMTLVSLYIQNYRETERSPLDWLGFVLTGLALSFLMYGMQGLEHGTGSAVEIVGFIAAGFACTIIAIIHSRKHPFPLVNLALMRISTFRVSLIGGSFGRLSIAATPFLLPLLFQVGFGMTAFASGLLTFAVAAGAVSMRLAAPRFFAAFGFKRTLIGNSVFCAATILTFVFVTPMTPTAAVLAALFLCGLLQSLQNAGLNVLAYADVPPPQMSAATSFAQFTQQFANAVGVATAATVLHLSQTFHGTAKLTVADFRVAFLSTAALTLSCLPIFLSLSTGAGDDVSGHKSKA